VKLGRLQAQAAKEAVEVAFDDKLGQHRLLDGRGVSASEEFRDRECRGELQRSP